MMIQGFIPGAGMEEIQNNLQEMLDKMVPTRKKKQLMRVHEARPHLIQDELERLIDEESVIVRPRDLRRTYARRLCEAGVDVTTIHQRLGQDKLRDTLRCIGSPDAKQGSRSAIFFDLAKLDRVPVQDTVGF